MAIKIGDKELKNLYIGDTPVKAVYLGDKKLRPIGRSGVWEFAILAYNGSNSYNFDIGISSDLAYGNSPWNNTPPQHHIALAKFRQGSSSYLYIWEGGVWKSTVVPSMRSPAVSFKIDFNKKTIETKYYFNRGNLEAGNHHHRVVSTIPDTFLDKQLFVSMQAKTKDSYRKEACFLIKNFVIKKDGQAILNKTDWNDMNPLMHTKGGKKIKNGAVVIGKERWSDPGAPEGLVYFEIK